MLIILSILTYLILLISYIETLLGLRSMRAVKDIEVADLPFPKLSIIVTACNEEISIAETLRRLEKQNYPNFEIICVNDRSVDATGDIINSFVERKESCISALHIDRLPAGWLGKNYASHKGAEVATGEWLLFMDADVHMNSDCLKRSMSHALKNKLDHISLLAHYICKGFLYNVVHLVHKGHGLVIPLKPWLAKSTRSKKSFNMGVFCLVKKKAYVVCGGHQAMALECVDDIRLGKSIKDNGFSQEVLNAQENVSIEWYSTLRGLFRGLQKNSYAYLNYKLIPTMLMTLAWYIIFVFPVAACFFTHGVTKFLNILSAVLLFLSYFEVAKFFKISLKYIWFYPLGLIIYPYVIINSVVHFYRNKGIYWRGTFYSADMLKGKN